MRPVHPEVSEGTSASCSFLKVLFLIRTANIILRPDHSFWDIRTTEQLYGKAINPQPSFVQCRSRRGPLNPPSFQLSDCLEENFPQLPIRDLISPQVAHQFVSRKGGRFPKPQNCSGMFRLFPAPSDEDGAHATSPTSPLDGPSEGLASRSSSSLMPSSSDAQHHQPQQAVLLIGDSVHSFPPDLGQVWTL